MPNDGAIPRPRARKRRGQLAFWAMNDKKRGTQNRRGERERDVEGKTDDL